MNSDEWWHNPCGPYTLVDTPKNVDVIEFSQMDLYKLLEHYRDCRSKAYDTFGSWTLRRAPTLTDYYTGFETYPWLPDVPNLMITYFADKRLFKDVKLEVLISKFYQHFQIYAAALTFLASEENVQGTDQVFQFKSVELQKALCWHSRLMKVNKINFLPPPRKTIIPTELYPFKLNLEGRFNREYIIYTNYINILDYFVQVLEYFTKTTHFFV
ncbi:uncharacterized protein LOC130445146 [Diorhabda sublineata]|uniref:uncharacterized protein LOC130445146 n=1 Tax=Diorhabda sublineata TaxID=1163346 RepID=UPI0024E140DD|nr:uncharacterized protein LOC130445146 [Diorhabda sublineata]